MNMKMTLSSTGLKSITLVYLIFVTTSWTWPHIHRHHHGLGHHAHHGHHGVEVSSGSGFANIADLTSATALSTGSGFIGSSCAYGSGSANNCISEFSKDSVDSEKSTFTAGTVDISQLQPTTTNTPQISTFTQADATTTIHITKTSYVTSTVRATGNVSPMFDVGSRNPQKPNLMSLGLVSDIHVNPTTLDSPVLNIASLAKRVASSNPFGGGYESFQLGPSPSPSSSSSPSAASATAPAALCPTSNGTIYTSTQGQNYAVVCDIDYLNNDLHFILASSFDECIQQCDTYNLESSSGNGCVGALFVPSRVHDKDDCYLKSTVNNPTPAQLSMVVGVLLSTSTSSSTNPGQPTTATLVDSPSATGKVSTAATTSDVVSIVPQPTTSHAPGTLVVVPSVAASHLHGPSSNKPTTQYIDWKPPVIVKLDSYLLSVGVNDALSTSYPPSLDTGVLELNASMEALLKPLSGTPHISRDGGRGGYLNGQHLFVFCDTGSYTAPTDSSDGNFLGFVSSSVAIDTGRNGLAGQALALEDGIGQWSDDVGRMRGFSPMTQGEQSYNLAMQGNGQRYAVWPESSLIPLDATTSILYAPIVYDNVNMATRAAVFTYTGAALLTITAHGKGGPVATRTVDRLFGQDEVEWGCIGGIRSWGPSGVGGTDGKVYLFGKVAGGLLLARTRHDSIADREMYEYWTGTAWHTTMPSASSTAYFIAGSFMDVDVFYSPRHLTFIIVYLNAYADNTFYFRYLKADHAILPPGAAGGDPSADYVEALVAYPWSTAQVLYRASPGLSGKYIYAGGVHQGYFGDSDITNGGTKMLLSWTAPTGLNPASATSEYQLVTADIEWA